MTFPSTIDTFTPAVPSGNITSALTNAQSNAIVAVEQTLGVLTPGPYSTVAAAISANILNAVDDLRLTLTSGTPVTSSDVTGASTLYLSPYSGYQIALYTGSQWIVVTTAEISLALGTLVSATNYDVFAYLSGTTVVLVLDTAWTNDTTRAIALSQQNGVLVLSTDATRRWVGIIRTTSTTTTEDSAARRFVCNGVNKVPRIVELLSASGSPTTTSASFGQVGSVQVEYLADGTTPLTLAANLSAVYTSSGAGTITSNVSIGSSATAAATNATVAQAQSPQTGTYAFPFHPQLSETLLGHYVRYLIWNVSSSVTLTAVAQTYGLIGSVSS